MRHGLLILNALGNVYRRGRFRMKRFANIALGLLLAADLAALAWLGWFLYQLAVFLIDFIPKLR